MSEKEEEVVSVSEGISKLVSSQMAEGSSVREYVMSIINLLTELDRLGVSFGDKIKPHFVLNSLPKSCNNFRRIATMSKREYKLNELLNDLVAAEGIMGRAPQAYSSSPKCGKKKKGNVNTDSKLGWPTGGIKKHKGKCHKCNKLGHWKADCDMK